MFIEIKFKLESKSDLEQVIVKTFFWYLNFFGSIFEWELLGLIFLIDSATVELAPLDDFVDYMSNSSLLGPSTFATLSHLIDSSLFFVFRISEGVLKGH